MQLGNCFGARLSVAVCIVASLTMVSSAQELVPVSGRPQGATLGLPASIRNVGARPAATDAQPAFQPQQIMPALQGAAQNPSFATTAQPPTRIPQSPDPYATPNNLPPDQRSQTQTPASLGSAQSFPAFPQSAPPPAFNVPNFQNFSNSNSIQPFQVPTHLPVQNQNPQIDPTAGQNRALPQVPLFVPPTRIPSSTDPATDGAHRPALDLNGLLSTEIPRSEPVKGTETILQRFPDGKIEIARQVKQDEAGNFVNHGVWKQFQQNGQLISAGIYQLGKRHGEWFHWHFAESNPALQLPPYNEFKGPFLSKGVFRDDQLNGVWLIMDRFQRPVSEIQFKDGKRQGVASWYFPNGTKRREITYRDGLMDGIFRQWDDKQKLTKQVTFLQGRPLLVETEFYDRKKGLKQSEQQFLGGMIVEQSPDNWSTMEVATYAVEGDKLKHGPITTWYPNGQLQMKGQYDHDMLTGQVLWWHENGQKQISGNYSNGQQTGNWVWWHENGMKSTQGSYDHDRVQGEWTWWDKSGGVIRREVANESRIVEAEQPVEKTEESQVYEQGIPPLRASTISNIKD